MAPRPDLFDACPLAVERLLALPPILRGDPDIRAVLYADAKETERQEQVLDALKGEFFPQSATALGMPIIESLLQIAVADTSLAIEQRQGIATGVFAQLRKDPSGLDWEAAVTLVLGTPGWTYEEHVEGDAGSPLPGVIRITVPFDDTVYDQDAAIARIETFTAAGTEIQIIFNTGFLVGVSPIGVQPIR